MWVVEVKEETMDKKRFIQSLYFFVTNGHELFAINHLTFSITIFQQTVFKPKTFMISFSNDVNSFCTIMVLM